MATYAFERLSSGTVKVTAGSNIFFLNGAVKIDPNDTVQRIIVSSQFGDRITVDLAAGDTVTGQAGTATQIAQALATNIFFLASSASAVRSLHTVNTQYNLTGTLAQTVLFSFTIPAGTMGLNSSLHILWTATGNAGNTRYTRIRMAGTNVTQGAILGSNTVGKWYFTISNRNALNSQITGNSTLGASTNTGFGASTGALGIYSIDFSQDVPVEVMGDLDVITDNIAIEHFECFMVP